MAHVASDAIGSILDNYADVIEGGNAWRGSGTDYIGIPGRQSNDDGLRQAVDTPLTADGAGSTTTVVLDGTQSWESSRWVKNDAPGFWLLCTAGNAQAVGRARKVEGWNDSASTFTVGTAWDAAPGAGATFTALQGFKRIQNNLDIEAEDTEAVTGYDRYFDVALIDPVVAEWWGAGYTTFNATLQVKLRILKYSREHDAKKSAIENIGIIATMLPLSAHYESSYTRVVLPMTDAPEITTDDPQKVVASVKFPITYRVQNSTI